MLAFSWFVIVLVFFCPVGSSSDGESAQGVVFDDSPYLVLWVLTNFGEEEEGCELTVNEQDHVVRTRAGLIYEGDVNPTSVKGDCRTDLIHTLDTSDLSRPWRSRELSTLHLVVISKNAVGINKAWIPIVQRDDGRRVKHTHKKERATKTIIYKCFIQ